MSGRFLALLSILLVSVSAASASEPTDRPPAKGGYTYSLGLPSLYKPYAGFELQSYSTGDNGELGGLLNIGVDKDLMNPIVGAAALELEAYGGYRGQDYDGGGRAAFMIPSLLLGAGVDYNITDDSFDFMLRAGFTTRRGGVFGAGTTVALRYLPTRDQTFSVGISVPLYGKHLGRSRARRDHVVMDARKPLRMVESPDTSDEALDAVLDELRERVRWVTRMTQPFAEVRGGDAAGAIAPDAEEIAAHIALVDERFPGGHTALAEHRAYHEGIERAIAIALGVGTGADARQRERVDVATAALREALLEEVLLPYNRLIGQYKKHDSLYGFISVAQSRFGRELLTDSGLPAEAARRAWYVFQSLCDHIEAERKAQLDRWEDPRFVWLPLQLALRPEDHDSQAEIDAIIERAVEQQFTPENRIWYVVNESFQWEMARTVRLTRDYHVLWIHDYRGVNGAGEPDLVALAHTINYVEAMTDRILEYDETGSFPTYQIIIDQHFFEINDGRRFLRLLERPLDYELGLPKGYEDWEQRVAEAQQRLREAVAGSSLLLLERTQYGEDWLRNLIKVHVNVTNQADPSFFSLSVAGFVPVPDNNMRDHRKIAFFDISEDDPYRGMAMFTGMGIGEHYAGANWEDRAIMIQGPGALEVKAAAREVLQRQGFEPSQIPWVLRPRGLAPDYDDRVAAERAGWTAAGTDSRGRVLQLHSETGFRDKPIEVAKAVLYTLMPPGSVLHVPDSLWQNYLYASMLAGSALRGCRVLVVSPAFDHAPAGGAANMARAHDLMARMIEFENRLVSEIDAAGGVLAIGLYAPRQEVGDIAGRFRQALGNTPRWLRKVFPVGGANKEAFTDRIDSVLTSVGYANPDEARSTGDEKPKLHLKANFFASKTGWEKLIGRPELARAVLLYVEYLAKQGMLEADATIDDLPDVRDAPAELVELSRAIIAAMVAECTAQEREELLYYFTVGSVNLDYRSMVLNAETMIIVSGWQSLTGFLDFLLLPGLCEWVDTTAELDELLPPPSTVRRTMSNFIRILL